MNTQLIKSELGLCPFDHIDRIISLSVITLSGSHPKRRRKWLKEKQFQLHIKDKVIRRMIKRLNFTRSKLAFLNFFKIDQEIEKALGALGGHYFRLFSQT